MKRFVSLACRAAQLDLLVLALALFWQAPLRAEHASRPVLEVVAAGPAGPVSALAARLRSLEARFTLTLHWSESGALDLRQIVARHAEVPGVFARVWLDLSDAQRAILFIANAGHDRLLVRVVPAQGGYGELTQESLATIVESAVDALLAGGQIGVEHSVAVRELEARLHAQPPPPAPEPESEPEPAPLFARAPAPAPPSPSASSHSLSLWLSGAYRGDALMAGPALRHGISFALACAGFFEPRLDLSIALSGQYFPPFSLGEEDQRVTQHGGGARAGIGATGTVREIFVWQTAVSAGVDLARVAATTGADSELASAAPFLATLPIVGALVSGAVRPAAWIELSLGVGMDLDLSGHHFDVQRANARTRAISPWRVHPYWLLGVGFPLSRRKAGTNG